MLNSFKANSFSTNESSWDSGRVPRNENTIELLRMTIMKTGFGNNDIYYLKRFPLFYLPWSPGFKSVYKRVRTNNISIMLVSVAEDA